MICREKVQCVRSSANGRHHAWCLLRGQPESTDTVTATHTGPFPEHDAAIPPESLGLLDALVQHRGRHVAVARGVLVEGFAYDDFVERHTGVRIDFHH